MGINIKRLSAVNKGGMVLEVCSEGQREKVLEKLGPVLEVRKPRKRRPKVRYLMYRRI